MLNSYLKQAPAATNQLKKNYRKTPSNTLSKLQLSEMDKRSNFQRLKGPCHLSVMESSTPMNFSYFYFSDGLQDQSNSSVNEILVLSKALQVGTQRSDTKYEARTLKVKSKNTLPDNIL